MSVGASPHNNRGRFMKDNYAKIPTCQNRRVSQTTVLLADVFSHTHEKNKQGQTYRSCSTGRLPRTKRQRGGSVVQQ